MTIINPNKEEIYNTEDRKLLISLLGEYSAKLLNVCEKVDIHQRREIIYSTIIMGTLFPLAFLLIILITNRLEDILKNIWFGAGIATIIVLFLFAVMFFSRSQFFHNKERLRLLKQDARAAAGKLEKVIRLASQIQEHVLNNIINEIELDLRLTDAELALQYYHEIKNKKML
jgi:hypothetical protein